jgi:diguanylate cyclase (GGDEF)-like protein
MTLMLTLILNPSIPAAGPIVLIASAVFVNLSGMAVSWRLHWLARRQFLSTQLEKELGLELEKLAFTDSLTGISNRRDFMVHANAELERHRRHDRPFTLLLLDLDYFKRINDRYGHEVGDQVLKEFAQVLRNQVRGLDVTARLGGEEFAILLPETLSGGAVEVAARIQAQTRQMRFGPDGEGTCTVSIGLAGVWPDDEGVEDILKRTDEAMYRAKAEGRDRMVSVARPIEEPQIKAS